MITDYVPWNCLHEQSFSYKDDVLEIDTLGDIQSEIFTFFSMQLPQKIRFLLDKMQDMGPQKAKYSALIPLQRAENYMDFNGLVFI